MATATKRKEIFYTLELSKKEASWLKDYLQNNLGAEPELPEHEKIREDIFMELKEEMKNE